MVFPHRGAFSTTPKRADTPVRPYGKRVVQTRKLSLPGRETTKPCGIHPASLSPRRIPFCPEADLALSFISLERPSTGNDAFPRICRYCVFGEMRENPRAESECSHRRGEEKMERAIRILPSLRVRNAARAHTPRLVREFPENRINIDKFTGFFDKKMKIFRTLSTYISMIYEFQRPFFRVFRDKKIQELCKIQAGYFSTRRFAITIRWMSFVPSPTCKRIESR